MFKLFFLSAVILSLQACTTFDRTTPSLKRTIVDDSVVKSGDDMGVRKRLMVLPFLDVSGKKTSQLVEDARRALLLDLQKGGEFVVIQNSDLKMDLENLKNDQGYKLEEISKNAKNIGANAIIEGKLLDVRVARSSDNIGLVRNLTTTFEVVAQIRVMNTRTHKEVFNTIKTVSLEQKNIRVAERVESDRFIENNPELIRVLVKDAFLEFSQQIVGSLDRVTWEGRIAAINGDRLFLNVGRVSGIQIGDLLRVTEDGDDIYDPESGGHLGKVQGRLKGTLEVISYFGVDGAIAVIHSGSGFRENDRVELY
ncbi:MAG: hypothetical protein ACLGGX_10035 [Bdellovibrionia bacterium]